MSDKFGIGMAGYGHATDAAANVRGAASFGAPMPTAEEAEANRQEAVRFAAEMTAAAAYNAALMAVSVEKVESVVGGDWRVRAKRASATTRLVAAGVFADRSAAAEWMLTH